MRMYTMARRALAVVLVWALAAPLFALGQKETVPAPIRSDMKIISEHADSLTFREADGKVVVLPKKPKRTIVCYGSVMDVWYMAGGTSLARVTGETNVPDEAKDLPTLGSFASLNTERMFELEPDFIVFIGSGSQQKVRELFEREGIPSVAITYNTYADFRIILDLFARLNSKPEIYEQVVIPVQSQVQEILHQVPDGQSPTVCILFSTTTGVQAETQNTITGDFVKHLGGRNIYEGKEGETRVDISLEYILAQNPDIIFVTTMGDVEKCKARMKIDVTDHAVWGELRAVKNGRWHYLDKSFSIYKPNRFYPKAFKIMAEYLYPNVQFSYTEHAKR